MVKDFFTANTPLVTVSKHCRNKTRRNQRADSTESSAVRQKPIRTRYITDKTYPSTMTAERQKICHDAAAAAAAAAADVASTSVTTSDVIICEPLQHVTLDSAVALFTVA